LYINIILNDYVGTLVGIPELNTAWFLNPYVGQGTTALSDNATPIATGNQVSCEFNLVYRFHMIISDRDDKWTQELFKSLFPGKDPATMGLDEFMQGLLAYLATVDPDPAKRNLHITSNIIRGPDGKFPDQPMIDILTETTEDCAGTSSLNNFLLFFFFFFFAY
jgi:linoleate 8R-lipoxygenase / 9,12-octadecadienoate 8-hydroperoxide 8R-isomerase